MLIFLPTSSNCLRSLKKIRRQAFELLQCLFGGVSIEDWNLRREAGTVAATASRVARALADWLRRRETRSPAAYPALLAARCLEARQWESPGAGGPQVLRQLDGIGPNTCAALARVGFASLADVARSSICIPPSTDTIPHSTHFACVRSLNFSP